MTIATDPGQRIPPSTLQNRLRDAREWRQLEQADLAAELGIGRSTVSNYERGITVPGKLVINAWAATCDVDVEWLKTGTEASLGGGDDDGTPVRGIRSGATLRKITLWSLASASNVVDHPAWGHERELTAA